MIGTCSAVPCSRSNSCLESRRVFSRSRDPPYEVLTELLSSVSRRTTPGGVERNFVTACPIALGFGFKYLVRHIKLRDDKFFRRLLCLLGLHDFRVVEVTVSFGLSGAVEKVECRRCGHFTTRRQRTT